MRKFLETDVWAGECGFWRKMPNYDGVFEGSDRTETAGKRQESTYWIEYFVQTTGFAMIRALVVKLRFPKDDKEIKDL